METAPKFRKRKKNSSSSVYIVHKTSHQKISRPSRAMTDGCGVRGGGGGGGGRGVTKCFE